jgi:hypothetical protein
MSSNWAVRLDLEIREGLDDPLAVIGGIVDASRGVESSLREWVKVARSRGHTWQEIADALRVSRQSAWERFKDVTNPPSAKTDPGFARAVERAYLRELSKLTLEPDADLAAMHKQFLASAIYAADRTNGGIRFKHLADSLELQSRLMRALTKRIEQAR